VVAAPPGEHLFCAIEVVNRVALPSGGVVLQARF
jgi:hypothetical protein